MKNFLKTLAIGCTLIYAPLVLAEEKKEGSASKEVEITKLSEAFGHLVGKSLQHTGVKFDLAKLIKGLQDEVAGKDSPMTEVECMQAISAVQEKVFKEQSEENLKKAESFLKENAKIKGMTSLENGKVQYCVEKPGNGASIEEHFSPLIRYTVKSLDGAVVTSSKEEERLCLDEIVAGLRAGLVGMKEGEKRTIYIHPDLAYGVNSYLPPNSLLTFEIELIQANAPAADEKDASDLDESETKILSNEVAEETHVR